MTNAQIKIIEHLASLARQHIKWHNDVNDESTRRVMMYSIGQLSGAYAMVRDTCDHAVTIHVNAVMDEYAKANND